MALNKRIIEIDPRKLRLLELNARYMRHEVFARLVENIRTDGGLTGNTPFCWRLHEDTTQQPVDPDGEPVYEVLSGNHRVRAAIAAGLPTIHVEVTDDYLPPERRKAIQLSHNALAGEDDPAVLKIIYEGIADTGLRLYTGIDDRTIKLLQSVQAASLSEAQLQFQTIAITFLPHEVEGLQEVMEKATKLIRGESYWTAYFADYDRTMDALETAGLGYNVKNTATALMIIVDVFLNHLDDLQAGYLDEYGNSFNHRMRGSQSHQVPLASLTGSLTIPSPVAAKLKKALDLLQRKDAVEAWDALADTVLKTLLPVQPESTNTMETEHAKPETERRGKTKKAPAS